MNTNDTQARVSYAAALARFSQSTGINAAELAELSGLEPSVLFDAYAGTRLPSASDRALIAREIGLIKLERS